MALVNFTIPNLFNGVSQQPITVRLPNQSQEQINSNNRITDGLSKRPPLAVIDVNQFIEGVFPDEAPALITDSDVKFHMLKGTDPAGNATTIQLLVKCSTGVVYATYLEGPWTGDTVKLGPFPYLTSTNKNDIKFLTNGDITYILNKSIIVDTLGTANTLTKVNAQGSLVYIQQGYFGTKYALTVKLYDTTTNTVISTVTASHSTAASTDPNISGIQASVIAAALRAALQSAITTAGAPATNITITWVVGDTDPWFACSLSDAYALTHRIEITAVSSTARTALYAFNGEAMDYTTLPPTAPNDYVIKINSDASSVKDDYYLRYDKTSNGWLETKQLGLNDYIDNTTMPVQILRLIEDRTNIGIAHMPISDREVGDLDTVPEPSFVGHRLNDIYIFNNRLGFLSQNNVILSKIDEYSVFYRTTVGTSLSADRIDLQAAVPSLRYSELNYAVPFDKELILFGDSAQYSLSAATGFDVKTASLATLTEYESSKVCPPVNIGASVYFTIERGDFTGIFDLSRKGDIGLTAEEVTQHVPTYIRGSVVEMLNSTTENMLFCRTSESKRTIYVQNRFIRQATTEQNAWHKWLLPNDIIGIYLLGNKLYITMVAENGTNIMRCSLDISLTLIEEASTTTINFTPFIDYYRLLAIGDTLSTSDLFADYFVNTEHVDSIIGVAPTGFIYRGIAAINAALVTIPLWVGIPFTFSYRFSQQTPAQYGQNGKTVMQYSNLTLRSMKISYTNTGKFDVIVTPTGRTSYTSYFTGNILGLVSSILGRINIYTGVFKFPVNSRADAVDITIQSNHPYPVTFNTCEWQGVLTSNSGRM